MNIDMLPIEIFLFGVLMAWMPSVILFAWLLLRTELNHQPDGLRVPADDANKDVGIGKTPADAQLEMERR